MAPPAVATGTDTIRVAGLNIWQSGADMVGPPVLCLHGIGGDRTSFADQLGQLGGRRVIAWNMPGYGGSDPLMQMDFAALSGAVVALLDALGIATVHLVGQSIGGMIAQEVAIRSSDRVASLGLIMQQPPPLVVVMTASGRHLSPPDLARWMRGLIWQRWHSRRSQRSSAQRRQPRCGNWPLPPWDVLMRQPFDRLFPVWLLSTGAPINIASASPAVSLPDRTTPTARHVSWRRWQMVLPTRHFTSLIRPAIW